MSTSISCSAAMIDEGKPSKQQETFVRLTLRMLLPTQIEAMGLELSTPSLGPFGLRPLAEPPGERNTEALFAAIDCRDRQPLAHGLLEQPFPLAISHLEPTRKTATELDEVIVEKDST